jgi:hypothetical protein
MKTILTLEAPLALASIVAAQNQLPVSMDPTYVPGLTANTVQTGPSTRATVACDDFNRAALGTDWIPNGGTPGIFSDQFGSGGGNSMAQHATASVAYDSATITMDLPDNPSGLSYGAAVHGLGGGQNLYTKVQGSGSYTNYGFYVGFNGGGSSGYGGYFSMSPAVTGGIVTFYVTNSGDTMNIDIDENRDGVVDYTYSSSGINAAGFGLGSGVGIGAYGSGMPSADDFELNGGCAPQGPTLASNGTAGAVITFDFANFGVGEQIAVVYGPAGPFAGNAPCGPVNASLIPLNPTPAQGLIILVADGAGAAQLVQNVPAAGAGLLVQALAMTSCDLTNTVTL